MSVALRHRSFATFWFALLVSQIGNWMQNATQSWLLYRISGDDPRSLGMLGLATGLAMVPGCLLGGVLADRVDRVRFILTTQLLQLGLVACLATLSALNHLSAWSIIGLGFAGSVFVAFDNPARQAMYPDLVPREALASAISTYQISFLAATAVGPAIGGFLLSRVGPTVVFAVNAFTFVPVLAFLVMRLKVPQVARPKVSEGLGTALMSGPRLVVGDPRLGPVILLSLVIGFFGRSYPQMLPALCRSLWHTSASEYGVALGAGGFGAILVVAVTAFRPPATDRVRLLPIALAVLFCSLALALVVPSYRIAIPFLVIAGGAGAHFSNGTSVITMTSASPTTRARVMSLWFLSTVGAQLAGAGIMGVVAKMYSARVAVGASLLMAVVGSMVVWSKARQARRPNRREA